MIRTKLLVGILILFSLPALATTLERGLSPAIGPENQPMFSEVYRIKIENKANGVIAVSKNEGASWEAVGKVLYPTKKVSKYGYSAAKWVQPGRVSATAVNAIHLKVGAVDKERTIFSLLPKEFLKPPGKYRSFLSPNSSIYTDIPAGTGIFGGGFSPFVGNLIMLSAPAKPVVPLPEGYVPQVGDTYYILVDRPEKYPKEIVFENRFGGQIIIEYFSGEKKIIGEVLRPIVGVGRFEGSLYVDPGRIRANHCGVIDVCVSPYGSLGGFQIVPALHGQDMRYVKKMTQWMVIGPANVADPSVEGMAPFYKYFIQPSYRPDDLEGDDWEEKLLSRFLVEVKMEGKDQWQPMPIFTLYRKFPLPKWANSALDRVSHLRILFPIEKRGN